MTEKNNPIFCEVQKFSSWVFVFIFSILIFVIVFVAVITKPETAKGNSPPPLFSLIIAIAVPLAALALFLLTRLETEVRPDGLYVRFFPFHMHFKKFTANDLKEYYARQYSPLAEYGGWGIRYGLFGAGRAYNAKGNKGVQLVFKNGKRLLIGSQKPDELVTALNSVLRKTD